MRKKCNYCCEEKDISLFSKHGFKCKDCKKLYLKKYYKENITQKNLEKSNTNKEFTNV